MAFKIIKEEKKTAVFREECPFCRCTFEFNTEDANFSDTRNGTILKVSCPRCNHPFYSFNVKPVRYDLVEQL